MKAACLKILLAHCVLGFQPLSALVHPQEVSRKGFFQRLALPLVTVPSLVAQTPSRVQAAEENDRLGLTDAQVKEIVKSDVIDRQFLATGKLTRSIYRPTATFTDEIDTYGLDQWMQGTQKLFVGEKSTVRLVGDIDVTPEKVEFRFDEDLMFRIPFTPVVSLTGSVILARDEAGYITSYKENWDQAVWTVIKSAKF